MSTLRGERLRLGYGGAPAVHDVSIGLCRSTVTTLLGPNGSGKSTLLRALGRLHAPDAGAVVLDGSDIARLPARRLAQRLAFLPQSTLVPPGVTTRELVAFGRYPHRHGFLGRGDDDAEAIEWALAVTGADELADRPVDALSGGERQRRVDRDDPCPADRRPRPGAPAQRRARPHRRPGAARPQPGRGLLGQPTRSSRSDR